MSRLFTLDEANKLIPVVEESLVSMQRSIQALLEVREQLSGASPASIETRNLLQESSFLAEEISDTKGRLDELGVQVKDVEVGRIDFPGQLGAEVVWLPWQKGQGSITHYQRVGEEQVLPLPGAAGDPPLQV